MIKNNYNSKVYSEVYSFINALGSYYIEKLPKDIYETIMKNRDTNYNPKFDKDQILKKDMISHEALALIAGLNLEYWCEDPIEKEKLKKIYINNSKNKK